MLEIFYQFRISEFQSLQTRYEIIKKLCSSFIYIFNNRVAKLQKEHTTFIAIFKNYIIDIFNNNRNLNYQNMLKFIH